MKKNHIFTIASLVLMLSFAAGCGSKYSRSTAEELGNSVFEIFKAKDTDGLKSLTPTKKDLLKTLDNSDMPDEEREEAKKEFEEEWSEIEKRMKERVFDEFDNLMKELESEEMDPSTATLVKVEVSDEKKRDGFQQADIDVFIKIGDEDFRLSIPNAGEMESGWVMSPRGFRFKEGSPK